MSPEKRRPTREALLDLVMQYGEAGRRIARVIRRTLGRSELVWDTWERIRNAQRMLGYMRDARHVPAGSVVFLGSSSVVRFPLARLFPGAPAVGRGLGAENVTDVLRRLRWTMPVARPSGVVVWAGANDLRALALDPILIVERVARLLDAIGGWFPGVALTLLGVPPWCDQTAVDLERLGRLNEGLRALAFARGHAFVDVCRPPLTDEAGLLVPAMADTDRKHVGPAGYEVLAGWILAEGGEAVRALSAASSERAEPPGAPPTDPGQP